MRRFAGVLLALSLVFATANCGDDDNNQPDAPEFESVEPNNQPPMTTPEGVETFEPVAP